MRVLLLLVILAMASPAFVQAQNAEQRLPAFTVLDMAGNPVASATFAADRPAVLVIVTPSCVACEHLLNGLARVAGAGGTPNVVVLIESSLGEAQRFRDRKMPPALAGARWVVDPRREAWTALDLHGAPMMMGIDTTTVAWSYAGNPNRSLLESLIRTWIGVGEPQ